MEEQKNKEVKEVIDGWLLEQLILLAQQSALSQTSIIAQKALNYLNSNQLNLTQQTQALTIYIVSTKHNAIDGIKSYFLELFNCLMLLSYKNKSMAISLLGLLAGKYFKADNNLFALISDIINNPQHQLANTHFFYTYSSSKFELILNTATPQELMLYISIFKEISPFVLNFNISQKIILQSSTQISPSLFFYLKKIPEFFTSQAVDLLEKIMDLVVSTPTNNLSIFNNYVETAILLWKKLNKSVDKKRVAIRVAVVYPSLENKKKLIFSKIFSCTDLIFYSKDEEKPIGKLFLRKPSFLSISLTEEFIKALIVFLDDHELKLYELPKYLMQVKKIQQSLAINLISTYLKLKGNLPSVSKAESEVSNKGVFNLLAENLRKEIEKTGFVHDKNVLLILIFAFAVCDLFTLTQSREFYYLLKSLIYRLAQEKSSLKSFIAYLGLELIEKLRDKLLVLSLDEFIDFLSMCWDAFPVLLDIQPDISDPVMPVTSIIEKIAFNSIDPISLLNRTLGNANIYTQIIGLKIAGILGAAMKLDAYASLILNLFCSTNSLLVQKYAIKALLSFGFYSKDIVIDSALGKIYKNINLRNALLQNMTVSYFTSLSLAEQQKIIQCLNADKFNPAGLANSEIIETIFRLSKSCSDLFKSTLDAFKADFFTPGAERYLQLAPCLKELHHLITTELSTSHENSFVSHIEPINA